MRAILLLIPATDVAEIFTGAIERYGTPASMLTDMACVYTAKDRGGKVVMETLTEALGVTYKHSSPRIAHKLRDDRTAGPVDHVGLCPDVPHAE
jgi:hypothetical protein